jgi:hypothetical protein
VTPSTPLENNFQVRVMSSCAPENISIYPENYLHLENDIQEQVTTSPTPENGLTVK